VIAGTVTAEGVPTVPLIVGGQPWTAVIDTGFNGDLELPDALRSHVNARFLHSVISELASGVSVLEDLYHVDLPFDGTVVLAEATFVPGNQILLGTGLLRNYRLTIDFPARTVLLERVP
jgi:predicted aspartyl protease